jgi:HEAT repeat protein
MSMKLALRAISVALLLGMFVQVCIAQASEETAWSTLNGGLTHKDWEKRARAVAVLGELRENKKAEQAAITALKDEKDQVRGAAAQALGEMGAKTAIPQLMGMMTDKEPAVILAAAHSLIALGDNRGYNAFYAVLTGQTKTGTSITDQQKKTLKDPKKMAGLGLQTGMGFVPFGGLAMSGFKTLSKDDTSPVLSAAALTLTKDPDPKSGQALADAATQKEKWQVRAAAFDAISGRGDPSLLRVAIDGLQDKQEEVQYSAAGAVIHLSDVQAGRVAAPKAAPAKPKSSQKKRTPQGTQ